MITIVIPTLNEEKYIGRLLESISVQTFKDYEVIVVDGRSKDNTVGVVEGFKDKMNVRVVSQPKVEVASKIAAARNLGAKESKGDYLLFLDSDVIIINDFLKNMYNEFEERFLDVATCYIIPLSDKYVDKVMHDFANLVYLTGQYLSPRAPGFCIMATKRMFNRIGGFNEHMQLAEDHDFVQRGGKIGRFRVIKSTKIPVSVRRLDEEGRAQLAKKYFVSDIYRIVKGRNSSSPYEYDFGTHD